jgi:rhodanese-related sulfurtransferase
VNNNSKEVSMLKKISVILTILIENGYNAFNMDGGMIAWNNMLEDQKKKDEK